MNDYLQTPGLNLPRGVIVISERTALRYMRKLGFSYRRYQQGIQYTDGHEREDVLAYRKKYLNKIKGLEITHKPPPTCSDGIPSWNSGVESRPKKVVFIYHDESVFYANDAPSQGWHDPDKSRAIRPKGKGKGIMVSDFITEYGGYLALTDEELQRARSLDPNFPRTARELFVFGEQYDGYWTNELLMAQVYSSFEDCHKLKIKHIVLF